MLCFGPISSLPMRWTIAMPLTNGQRSPYLTSDLGHFQFGHFLIGLIFKIESTLRQILPLSLAAYRASKCDNRAYVWLGQVIDDSVEVDVFRSLVQSKLDRNVDYHYRRSQEEIRLFHLRTRERYPARRTPYSPPLR